MFLQKLIKQTKVPEDWDSGFLLNLYHTGFTFAVAPNTKRVCPMITYDECDFLKFVELLSVLREISIICRIFNRIFISSRVTFKEVKLLKSR